MEKKFRIISILFVIGCICFYGGRLIYFYNKYNTKASNSKTSEVLGITIQKKGTVSKGDGLYNNSGELVFKGSSVDNYLMYSNILWRIVKINNDNSIVLTTDSVVTNLAWSNGNSDYSNSYINEWLNKEGTNTGIFKNKLNDTNTYLVPNTVCLDTVDNINKITCNKKENNSYVTVLSISDYLNSKSKDSYLDSEKPIWLNNTTSKNNVWYINKNAISNTVSTEIYGIKPVITLKNTIGAIKGNGTKENPYVIEKQNKKVGLNSYVKLGNDLYTVYDKDNSVIRLVSDNLINDIQNRSNDYYSTNYNPALSNSIAYYLNNTYYDSLSYKNNLVDCDFYTGDYSKEVKYDYKNIYKTKITAKVGLLNIADINLNNDLNDYFLLNKISNYTTYSVNNNGKEQIYINKIRPAVCIKSDTKLTGEGTKTTPFELEVQ